jgi:hypothetical protein
MTGEETKLAGLIQLHQKMRPGFDIQDAYKMLYQGNLGIEHIMGDTVAAKEYLEYEMSTINETEFPDESLIENISVDSSIVRINLRPFKRLGLNPDKLWRTMVVSSLQYPKVDEKFIRSWKTCIRLCEIKVLSFDMERVLLFEDQMKSNNYRSAHHSNNYMDTYKPAYRVVMISEFKKLFQLSY